MSKRVICLILTVVLLMSFPIAVHADEPAAETDTAQLYGSIITINTLENFLEFAENCRLDSYSRNLTFVLETDIDLTDTEFAGIPIFSGTFEGSGHAITGLSITNEGSVQGLFRYLQSSAIVRNLKVEGSIAPAGSQNTIGGIAGSNAGLIENCSFAGPVAGADDVGGLVGVNELTGIIDNCTVSGSIIGNHFVGGIAGENTGVIRGCTSNAAINTTAAQNSVEISEITLDTLIGSESADTVTDVGGIAGSSSGVIRDCVNYADVGYQHMGYNIGGIAGTQSGYISGCTNYGQIYGRKEVGGIAGQMEPAANIEYSEDALQILEGQLGTLSSLTNRATANAQSSASSVNSQIAALEDQVKTAQDAVGSLIPDADNPSLPDADTILAAQNTLSSSISSMSGTMDRIASTAQSAASTLSRDMQVISNQINAMGGTIRNAPENLGGSITDISDQDTADNLTAKVENCFNHGEILADLNAGGITGAIAFENDLDAEEDIDISGDESLNFESEVRAVILNCENTAMVTVTKQYGGGIAGWMYLGLVKNCLNSGPIDAETADYVGGIAGSSSGYIRACSAKCIVEGGSYVGGIAGTGSTVSDCRSMVQLSGAEKLGAIAGYAGEITVSEEEQPILGNFYLIVGSDIGGIDGISYDTCAQPMDQERFLALEGLSEVFQTVKLQFVFEDGTRQSLSLAPGSAVPTDQIPALPEKDGYSGVWEGLEHIDLTSVSFDASFSAAYTQTLAAIESEMQRHNGLPVLLVEGEFTQGQTVSLTELTDAPALIKGQTLLEGFHVSAEGGTVTALRYLPNGEYDAETLRVLVRSTDGIWQEASFTEDGSYLVFAATSDHDAFCVIQDAADHTLAIIIAACTAAALIAAVVLIRKRRRTAAQKVR